MGWGVALWAIGYVLGFVFYAFVPPTQIGWYIMPIGIVVTLWVLLKKIHGDTTRYYVGIGIVWTLIAVVLDWVFIIQVLRPMVSYYKTDVYVYYALTYLLPAAVGLYRKRSHTLSS